MNSNGPKVGDAAPDFTLSTHNEGELNLAWYQGRRNVILAFYPGDFTPVCSAQIPGYAPLMETFEEYDCQILGISVDSVACHIAWARSLGGLPFPLMSDFYPHGEVADRYGVLADRGYAERVVILIDKKGIIRLIDRVPLSDLPDNETLLQAIRDLAADK